MKLTTIVSFNLEDENRRKDNANCLSELLDEIVGMFNKFAVKNEEPACYAYCSGFSDDLEINAISCAHGSDLPLVLRKFAERVACGAGDDYALVLDVEISADEGIDGLRIVVSEKQNNGSIFRWTIVQLPARNWQDYFLYDVNLEDDDLDEDDAKNIKE